jgi:acetyl esterase/lipase
MEQITPVRRQPTLFERVMWKVFVKSFKVVIGLFVYFNTKVKRRPPHEKPTYIKRYPVRPGLDNHVWIPKTYVSGASPPLPLLIDIHGGGFTIGHPFVDDKDNAIFCHTHGICVVSINYRKAPEYRFPTHPEDVAALIQAVLDDPELPVDKSKVAIIGYSAGANLALTGPQLNGLREKIKGVVAFYPVTDFNRTLSMRIATATPPPNREDVLIKASGALHWFYLRGNQDFKNPILSPIYAERKNLPQKLFLLGCEYDVLCAEARDAAEKYAEQEAAGSKKVTLDQGRTGWTCGNVTWEELKGLEHGYNQRWEFEGKELGAQWKRRTEEILAKVAEWLYREVYSPN